MKATQKYLIGAAALAMMTAIAAPASAQNIIGPSQITAVTSTIPGGSATYTLPQIADTISSDASPFNGFQGAQNTTGTISFTLDQAYDLTQFHLWNDINVRAEGVGRYQLKFYDPSNALVGTQGPFSTIPGQVPAHINNFSISNVKRVELEVLTIQNVPSTFSTRVEIREVAMQGTPANQVVDVPGDHYQCYRAEGPTLKPETITVADQFGKAQLVLGRPELVCNPSTKRHGDKSYQVENQKRHLICYSLVKQSDQPRSRKVKTANQFTTANLLTNERRLFCVPSYKKLIGEKESPVNQAD